MTSPSAAIGLFRIYESWQDFFRWWKSEIASLVPHPVRDMLRKSKPTEHALTISRDGYRLNGEAVGPAESLPMVFASLKKTDRRESVRFQLILDETRYLERQISRRRLPLSDLRRAAELDILTDTPFKRDDIHLLLPEEIQDNASYFIVKREVIEDIRWQIDRLSIDIASIRLGAGQVSISQTDWPPGLRPKRRAWATLFRYLPFLLAVVGGVYTIETLTQKFVFANRTLDVEIGSAEKHAHAARAKFDGQAKRLQQLNALKRKQASTLEVGATWEELSRILPDTTFLTDLVIANGKVEITGYSTTPASLIGRIEDSALFTDARFISPVVKVPGFEGDNFLISFERERQ